MEEEVKKCSQLISKLYSTKDGGVGGYGHIVFDDLNFENEVIEWCIKEAEKGEYDFICEEARVASLNALKSVLSLPVKYRFKAVSNK